MLDEAELLARARQLDNDALAQAHDLYYGPVYRYVLFRVSDQHIAEDLTSEVFVRLLDALQSRQPPQTALRGWLFTVAAHLVSDHFRRSYRRPEATLDDTIPSTASGPAEHAETQNDRENLRTALNLLTEEQKQVLALRFGQELPIQTVAQTLGKSEGAVKQLQARAIAALARWMVSDA